MIQLEQTDEGILLPVKARAGARRNGISGEHDGMLKVSVTQAAEQGKANTALMKVIARDLGLRNSQVVLKHGTTSANKLFLIVDADIGEIRNRVRKTLDACQVGLCRQGSEHSLHCLHVKVLRQPGRRSDTDTGPQTGR